MKPLRLTFAVIASALLLASAHAQSCPDVPSEHTAVTQTMREFYAAASKDDFAAFGRVLAPGFYAFDGGERYAGTSLLKAVKTSYQDKGYIFHWSVTDPKVHVACNMAWITYTNVGSITTPAGKTAPARWLESAVLRKRHGRWLIEFFQSTMVPQS